MHLDDNKYPLMVHTPSLHGFGSVVYAVMCPFYCTNASVSARSLENQTRGRVGHKEHRYRWYQSSRLQPLPQKCNYISVITKLYLQFLNVQQVATMVRPAFK